MKMMARYHFFVAAIFVIAFGFYWTPILIIPFMLGAVLVDFDHQVDFFLLKKRITFSVTELSTELSKDLTKTGRFILPFHSYEAIIISILIMPVSPDIIGAFSIGLILHMTFDVFTNGYPSAKSFSLIYRLKNWWKDFC